MSKVSLYYWQLSSLDAVKRLHGSPLNALVRQIIALLLSF